MESNELKLMEGDIAMVNNPNNHPKLKDIPLVIKGYNKCLDLDGKTWTMSYSLEHINQKPNTYYDSYSQFSRFIQPIPLTSELLEKIEGMESNPYNDTYVYGSIVIHCDMMKKDFTYWVEMGNKHLPIQYLHTLQQLIRLFTGKEIEVKW